MSKSDFRLIVRFLFVGGVNTIFGWVVYSGSIVYGFQPWEALIVGMLAGVCFNFISLGGFVFKDMSLRRLPFFIGAYLLIYLVNVVALEAIKRWVDDPIMAQLILAPPMALVSFVLMSRKVFRPNREIPI